MTLDIFNKVDWIMSEALSAASSYDESITIQKVLETKVSIKDGDRVVILATGCEDEGKVILSMPIRGKSVKSVMNAFETGLHRPLVPSPRLTQDIYSIIASYCDSNYRLKLINKYEKGTLKPWELYGDHIYFEGVYRTDGYLYIITGS